MWKTHGILPFLIKIILWGTTKEEGAEKVPAAVRILLALLLGIVYTTVIGLLFWVGIADQRPLLTALGAVCAIGILAMIALEIKTAKNKH